MTTWNYRIVKVTNETTWYNLTEWQHHDFQYNPATQTFMVLEYENVEVANQTGL